MKLTIVHIYIPTPRAKKKIPPDRAKEDKMATMI
jgi:hypothetical protein